MNPTDVISQAEVEQRIVMLTEQLDEQTTLFSSISEDRAEAESAYRYAFARGIVEQAGKVPVATKEAVAHLRSPEAFRQWKILEAREKATQQKLMAIRAQLEALRTIAANVRALTR